MSYTPDELLRLADQFQQNAEEGSTPEPSNQPISPQALLQLAAQFEKMAVDVEQPPEFDDDYTKFLKMLDTEGPATAPALPAAKKHEAIVEIPEVPVEGEMGDQELEGVKTAKEKLDPKAKVRNRGTVCVPASEAKDKKDHFPINDEGQARNALARVHGYDKVPPWYKGSLKGLQDLVSRKVHSKYPSIGKDKKKSSWQVVENLLAKYGK